ncbi:hypothetical protein MRB53_033104 [Persea americana]|uniref:Uncharacterized protein n=1 Tax=Persea americana TaxID=3435 RepID=A0ACC2KTR1_PERAE|nr:hypothetical protein MRB53_033104 [Persea americana]
MSVGKIALWDHLCKSRVVLNLGDWWPTYYRIPHLVCEYLRSCLKQIMGPIFTEWSAAANCIIAAEHYIDLNAILLSIAEVGLP